MVEVQDFSSMFSNRLFMQADFSLHVKLLSDFTLSKQPFGSFPLADFSKTKLKQETTNPARSFAVSKQKLRTNSF